MTKDHRVSKLKLKVYTPTKIPDEEEIDIFIDMAYEAM